LIAGETYTGYMALCAAVNRAIDGGLSELTQPSYFQSVEKEKLASLLKGDGGVDIPLLDQRVANLHQVKYLVVLYSRVVDPDWIRIPVQ
jgi:hypothetical protein